MDSEESSYLSVLLWYFVYLLLCFTTCLVLRCLRPNKPSNASEFQALAVVVLYDAALIELVRISYRISWYFFGSACSSLPYAVMHVITSVLPTLFWCLLSHIAFVVSLGIMQLVILRLIHKDFTLAAELQSPFNKYNHEPVSSQQKIEAAIARQAGQLLLFIPQRQKASDKSDKKSRVTRTDEFMSLMKSLLNFAIQISSLAATVISITHNTILQNIRKDARKKHGLDVVKAVTYPMAVGVVSLLRFLASRLLIELRRGVTFVKHVVWQSKDSVDSSHEITEEDLLPDIETDNGKATKKPEKSKVLNKKD